MKLGRFKTIAEPDHPACWLHKNVRVKGYVGEVELPTDQFILRPIDHVFQEACTTMRSALATLLGNAGFAVPTEPEPDEAVERSLLVAEEPRIVSVEEIDDYGSLLFKWRYWGVPEK